MSSHISNAFISLNDIVNNFLISYTGPGKLIPDGKRTEVIFHARRCLQEFAYETLKSKFDTAPAAVGTGITYNLPSDFVAIVQVIVQVNGIDTILVETKNETPDPGEYYINYTNKTIKYGTAGNAILTYLSNALTTSESAAIPKLAEEALYACIIYAVLANRENTRPDVLQRLLIEKTDKLDKAKSRLVTLIRLAALLW